MNLPPDMRLPRDANIERGAVQRENLLRGPATVASKRGEKVAEDSNFQLQFDVASAEQMESTRVTRPSIRSENGDEWADASLEASAVADSAQIAVAPSNNPAVWSTFSRPLQSDRLISTEKAAPMPALDVSGPSGSTAAAIASKAGDVDAGTPATKINPTPSDSKLIDEVAIDRGVNKSDIFSQALQTGIGAASSGHLAIDRREFSTQDPTATFQIVTMKTFWGATPIDKLPARGATAVASLGDTEREANIGANPLLGERVGGAASPASGAQAGSEGGRDLKNNDSRERESDLRSHPVSPEINDSLADEGASEQLLPAVDNSNKFMFGMQQGAAPQPEGNSTAFANNALLRTGGIGQTGFELLPPTQQFMRNIQLVLDPGVHGPVGLRMSLNSMGVDVQVETSNTETAELLSSEAANLRENLRQTGLELSGYAVQLSADGAFAIAAPQSAQNSDLSNPQGGQSAFSAGQQSQFASGPGGDDRRRSGEYPQDPSNAATRNEVGKQVLTQASTPRGKGAVYV